MGQKVVQTCDVCGKFVETPHTFMITTGRQSVSLDLCDEHAKAFSEQFYGKGTPTKRSRSGAGAIEAARQRDRGR